MSSILLLFADTCTSTFSLVAIRNIGIGWQRGYIRHYRKKLEAAISHIESQQYAGDREMNGQDLSNELEILRQKKKTKHQTVA